MLLNSSELVSEYQAISIRIREKLGEGGQGEIYRVESPNGDFALKWYYAYQATEAQQKAIRELIQHGAPGRNTEAARRFIWPIDLVTVPGRSEFGYLMPLIDMSDFTELGEVWGRRKPQPSPKTMCETLSTDGLRNAYADDAAFHRLLAAVHSNIAQHGLSQATHIIPERLDHFSTEGSGDDITLLGMRIDQ